MTISSTTRKAGPFIGDGVTTVFPFTFKVFSAADLLVVQLTTVSGVEAVKALASDYTVVLNANQNATPGGTLTMMLAPPAGSTLTFTSAVANLQSLDLTNAGGFYPKVINDALDRATIQIQQIAEKAGRALQLPISSTPGSTTTVPGNRAGSFLIFDALGNPALSSGTGADSGLRADLGVGTDAAKGTSLLGHLSPAGVATTAQAAIRAFQPRNGPLLNQKFELVNDTAPLNYTNTRAIGVIQHRDTANAVLNDLIPGFVSQFTVSGSGFVNAATEYSGTIWLGDFSSMTKTGDGSAHCYTGIGNLGAVGPGGYNELGAFQSELTNNGSVLGNISGFEVYIKDSPDQGATTYSTRMAGHVSRIAKYNPTIRKSFSFFASSEGTQNINAILGVNLGGGKFQRGFDFTNAAFSTGQFGLAPNNTAMAWYTAAGAAVPILGVDGVDRVYLKAATTAAFVELQDAAGLARLQVPGVGGNVSFQNANLSTTATAGANGATPAQVAGYLILNINNSLFRFPYYN